MNLLSSTTSLMNSGSSLLTWFCRNYISKECLPQQIPAEAAPLWVLIHRLFNCGFSPHRVAIKLWKPCSEANNSHPEGIKWGGGSPPLMALAGVHAGTAVCSYVPEMKEDKCISLCRHRCFLWHLTCTTVGVLRFMKSGSWLLLTVLWCKMQIIEQI